MSSYQLEPAPGKIVVEPHEAMQSDRIILTELKQRGTKGTVVAVYEPFIKPEEAEQGIETEAFFKIGDTVIYGPHSGVDLRIDRRKLVVLKETEILMKIVEIEAAETFVGETPFDDMDD